MRTLVSGNREAQGRGGRRGRRTSSMRNGTRPTQAVPSARSTSSPGGSSRWTTSGGYGQCRKVTRSSGGASAAGEPAGRMAPPYRQSAGIVSKRPDRACPASSGTVASGLKVRLAVATWNRFPSRRLPEVLKAIKLGSPMARDSGGGRRFGGRQMQQCHVRCSPVVGSGCEADSLALPASGGCGTGRSRATDLGRDPGGHLWALACEGAARSGRAAPGRMGQQAGWAWCSSMRCTTPPCMCRV